MSLKVSTKKGALVLALFLLASVSCGRLGGSGPGCNLT
jgi:hypothetical protein